VGLLNPRPEPPYAFFALTQHQYFCTEAGALAIETERAGSKLDWLKAYTLSSEKQPFNLF